jgi:hypothetical protein
MEAKRAAVLWVLATIVSTASAQWREWDTEFDDGKKTWKEIQAQIPAYPKAENLARVPTGSATSHQFFIDTASVSIGEDGVARYTVVVKTSGGATNVMFEGIRCETREQKLYAIGHSDGVWARARDTSWRRVVLRDLTPHHHTLYYDYFCAFGYYPVPLHQVVDALKRGYGLKARPAAEG